MRKLFLLLFMCCMQISIAQVFKTSQNASDIIYLLSKSNAEWNVPISANETIPIQWKERKSSFSDKGFKSFVGYYNDNFIATISIHSSKINGDIFWKDVNYKLGTSDNGLLLITKEEKNTLISDEEIHPHSQHRISSKARKSLTETTSPSLMKNDNVLRVYRLALCIGYPYFNEKFHNNVDEVRAYWAKVETFLNEIYTRDLGVKFNIVDDEKLILNKDNDVNSSIFGPGDISQMGYVIINELIKPDSYDAGIIVTKSKNPAIDGAALTEGVYMERSKAYAMAVDNLVTIGHELGHLFGSGHTFTTGGTATYFTETDRGQSIMSYGPTDYRHFFSLISSFYIRNRLKENPYYTNETKDAVINDNIGRNPSFGIVTDNTAPVIDRNSIKPEYTITRDTYFQFNIKAKDKEQKELTYYAHQADINQRNARFWTFKPQRGNNTIAFQRTYDKVGLYEIEDAKPKGTGTFTFWLGVNDYDTKNPDHATMYDMVATKVNIVDGIPFKFTSDIKNKYSAGEKVTLNWSVDPIFKDTKVRILMSDDFGETFKYVLASDIENNGTYEITIPYITLGRQNNWEDILTSGKGLFKIEIIDNIAHDISNNDPKNVGGFEIINSGISFENLPTNEIIVENRHDIPEVAQITATTKCSDGTVNIVMDEKSEGNLITRTWTATDSCGNTATFIQKIHILSDSDSNPDTGNNDNLTTNISTEYCQFELDETHNLTKEKLGKTKDLTLEITEINGVTQSNLFSLASLKPQIGTNTIKWKATDNDGNITEYTQTINFEIIGECHKPAVSGDSLPSDVLISTLNRNNMTTKQNGILVLESKSKGLVLTKISVGEDISSIQNPVNGMIVFDENDNCIKLFDGTNWDCIKQKAVTNN